MMCRLVSMDDMRDLCFLMNGVYKDKGDGKRDGSASGQNGYGRARSI